MHPPPTVPSNPNSGRRLSEAPKGEALFRGSLPPHRLGELLLRIADKELTGRLELAGDTGERTIVFHSGYPVFSQSSLFGERLGALGVRYRLFDKEAVARALDLARDQHTELGRALLELGHVGGASLFALLGCQLLDQLAATCSSAHTRVRFLPDAQVPREVAILRVHPLTAVLASVRRLPVTEQAKMLAAVNTRKVSSQSFGPAVCAWLAELGLMGQPENLLRGQLTVGTVRTRLAARLGVSVQRQFDPKEAPLVPTHGGPDGGAPNAKAVADMVMLSLLLSGSLELGNARAQASDAAALPNTAEAVQATLEDAPRSPLPNIPSSRPPPPASEPDRSIRNYLHEPRRGALGTRMAIWGPAAEEPEDELMAELLTLYLTLKLERSPREILSVDRDAGQRSIRDAHAKYAGFLDAIDENEASILAHCKVQELRDHIDWALEALVEGASEGDGNNAMEPAQQAELAELAAAPSRNTPTIPPPPPTPSQPSAAPTGGREDSTVRTPETTRKRVDGLLRAADYSGVIRLLEPHQEQGDMPPDLKLAQAIAQRELSSRTGGTIGGGYALMFVALMMGVAIGWVLRHLELLVF